MAKPKPPSAGAAKAKAGREATEIDPEKASAAFAKLEPALRKIPQGELVVASVDVADAVLVALGAHAHLVAARDAIRAELKSFDVAHIDTLVERALAAWWADRAAHLAEDETAALGDLLPRAETLRDELFAVAEAAAKRKRLPRSVVDEVRPGGGYVDRANDLVTLAGAFRERWDTLKGRVDTTPEELDEAERLGTQILARLAARRNPPPRAPGEPTRSEMRRRAFTYFHTAYEECRRGAACVWWYEDWEARVPSLWSLNVRSSRPAKPDEEPAPKPPIPPAG